MEALQIWHFTFQLRQINLCIYLIGQQDRFLFMNRFLIGRNLDEKISTRNRRTSLSHTRFIIHIGTSVHIRSTIGISGMTRNTHLNSTRSNSLTIYYSMRRSYRIRTILCSIQSISNSNGRRRTGMSVNHLIAGLLGSIRTGNHFQSFWYSAHAEFLHITRINSVSQTEVLTRRHMRWSRYNNMLSSGTQSTANSNHHQYRITSNMFHYTHHNFTF